MLRRETPSAAKRIGFEFSRMKIGKVRAGTKSNKNIPLLFLDLTMDHRVPSGWLYAYLRSLYEVFSRRLITNQKLVPANLSLYGAKTAVILRMLAIDGIADEFEKAVNRPNRAAQLPMRMSIENQLL